jgi:hypothetical protein
MSSHRSDLKKLLAIPAVALVAVPAALLALASGP